VVQERDLASRAAAAGRSPLSRVADLADKNFQDWKSRQIK
jgi:hypothetical protein